MIGMTPELWFSMFLIGAPCSRMLVSSNATPPPRLDSCSAELIERPIDSMLSSMRSRKQLTGSPRCFLPELRNVGVAGWNRPSMISSTSFSASLVSPAASVSATMHHAVLEALQVALPVEGLQRVRGVVLERAEEGREPELLGVARSSSDLTKLREYWSRTSRS